MIGVNGDPDGVTASAILDPVASILHRHPDLSPGAVLTLAAMRSVDAGRDWSSVEVSALMNTTIQRATRWLTELRYAGLVLGIEATVMGGVRMRYEVVSQ